MRISFVFTLLILCTACGTQTASPDLPDGAVASCTVEAAPGQCGLPCVSDAECGNGTFCLSGACDAVCTLGGNECGNGRRCTASGRCETDPGLFPNLDAGASDTGTCGTVELFVERQIPNVIVIMDRSGSMAEPFDADRSRWASARRALINPNMGLVTRLQSIVRFGINTYTEEDGSCPPEIYGVYPALDNRVPIKELFDARGPEGDTPTGQAIRHRILRLEERPVPEGPIVFLLVTDGEPNTCGSNDGQEGPDGVLRQVRKAFNMNIRTYVLGLAFNSQHLQDVANAGVGVSGGAKWWTATNTAQLDEALTEIVVDQIPCTVEIDGRIDTQQACTGTVELGGVELACNNATRGWQATGETTLELLGTACDEWREGTKQLRARFPCGALIVE